jgi:hypothetical protein
LSGEHFKFEDVTSVTVGEEDVRSHSGHDGPGPAVAKNLWRHTAVTMVKARMGEGERQGEEMDRGYPLKNKTYSPENVRNKSVYIRRCCS